jgi:peroxiredoxin Q/BCP
MKIHRVLAVALAVVAASIGGVGMAADLNVGDEAPAFALTGSDGKQYTLEQYVGVKPVVLAWFPKAFTGG